MKARLAGKGFQRVVRGLQVLGGSRGTARKQENKAEVVEELGVYLLECARGKQNSISLLSIVREFPGACVGPDKQYGGKRRKRLLKS